MAIEFPTKLFEYNDPVPKKELVSEDEYIKESTAYALALGWVKAEQEGILVEKYLRPIYHHCLSIISDIKENGVTDGYDYNRIINKLNWCLNSTRRIGSTEHSNVLNSILDYKKTLTSDEEEYAVQSFYEFVDSILNP